MQPKRGKRQQSTRRSLDEATVRIGASLSIPAVLSRLGADPAKVLAEAGFDLHLFDNPETRISFAARGRLVCHCAEATGCDHFGLLVGQQNDLKSMGLVGLLVRYSPDVKTALRSLVRHFHLHAHGAVMELARDGDIAELRFAIYHPNVVGASHVGDASVATMFNIMNTLCGPHWTPAEVQFALRGPKDVRPYRQFFGVPVLFDAENYALVFSADYLGRPLPGADSDLHCLLQQQIDALEARHGDDFPEQVRSVLRTALPAAHGKADQVAALFSMHRRTLCRRLTAHGTSFQALVDEIRYEIARQFLEDSEADVGHIAAMLDYADASAFTRAFRRWSGCTPARWRAGHGGSQPL
jgi:AraC-like DNA-binding protein